MSCHHHWGLILILLWQRIRNCAAVIHFPHITVKVEQDALRGWNPITFGNILITVTPTTFEWHHVYYGAIGSPPRTHLRIDPLYGSCIHETRCVIIVDNNAVTIFSRIIAVMRTAREHTQRLSREVWRQSCTSRRMSHRGVTIENIKMR
ncbi:hypothetical protein EJ08DRAFT_394218 [Tothia fuscella]|uniref:Secreted protein n=1 Tax=Tothia fuscella TaxID=1048955 RepID=A0A9P4P0N5_9PEZI|nr:hypothetical protein EJ08DRAFT_394218 [Tothia fuscella]